MSQSHKEKRPRVRRSTTWHDWLSLVLLTGTLGIAIYSITQSKWIDPQPALLTVFGLGILAGLVLFRLPAAAAHPLALVGGVAVTVWQMRLLLPWADTIPTLLRVLINIRPSQSTIPFAIFLAIFTLAMAYVAAWYLMRHRNAWVGVLLGAAALLVNLSNLADEHYRFFALYLTAAALLIGQATLAKHYSNLKKWGARYGVRNAFTFVVSVAALSLLLTSVTWALPDVKVRPMQAVFNTKALAQAVDNTQINIFASVPAKWSVLRNEHQNDLAFNPPNLSQEVQFTIASDKPLAFWRLRRYDIYSTSGWTSSRTDEALLKAGTAVAAEALPPSRAEVTYKVTSQIKTDVLIAAGEFVSADIQVALYNLESQNDIMSVTSEHLLTPNDSYNVRTVINVATPSELAQASAVYPEHIRDHYLQLPSDLPRRVRSTTQIITRNARNPYDKAVAIVKYLSRFNYVREGTSAPFGADAVDYFLTTSQSGNCNNFASAMVVMLRSIGVPARLATGYLLREKDEEGALALRAVDYHARPEVYFPGYSWVEFEATPIAEIDTEHEERTVTDIVDSNVGPSLSEIDAIADEPDTLAFSGGTPTGEREGPVFGFEAWIDDATAMAPIPRSLTETLLRPTIIGLLALAFAAFVFRQLRRFRDASQPALVYSRMCSLARFARLRPSPHQTPLEYCARLSAAFPAQSQAFNEVTWAYLKSEYGQKNPGEEGRENLQQAWRMVYRALLRRSLRRA